MVLHCDHDGFYWMHVTWKGGANWLFAWDLCWEFTNHVNRFCLNCLTIELSKLITIRLVYLSNNHAKSYNKHSVIRGLRWEFTLHLSISFARRSPMDWQRHGVKNLPFLALSSHLSPALSNVNLCARGIAITREQRSPFAFFSLMRTQETLPFLS